MGILPRTYYSTPPYFPQSTPRLNIVYSYSSASAGAMRMLATLIMDRAVQAQRVTHAYQGRPLPPPQPGEEDRHWMCQKNSIKKTYSLF